MINWSPEGLLTGGLASFGYGLFAVRPIMGVVGLGMVLLSLVAPDSWFGIKNSQPPKPKE